MASLFFYLTNLIMRFKRDVFTKNERFFLNIFVFLDMIATTDVLMMRLSYRYICRAHCLSMPPYCPLTPNHCHLTSFVAL